MKTFERFYFRSQTPAKFELISRQLHAEQKSHGLKPIFSAMECVTKSELAHKPINTNHSRPTWLVVVIIAVVVRAAIRVGIIKRTLRPQCVQNCTKYTLFARSLAVSFPVVFTYCGELLYYNMMRLQ